MLPATVLVWYNTEQMSQQHLVPSSSCTKENFLRAPMPTLLIFKRSTNDHCACSYFKHIYWHIVITFIPRFCVTLRLLQSMFIELEEKWFIQCTLNTKCIQLEYLSKFDQLSISVHTHKTFRSPFLLSFVCPLCSTFFSLSVFSPIPHCTQYRMT